MSWVKFSQKILQSYNQKGNKEISIDLVSSNNSEHIRPSIPRRISKEFFCSPHHSTLLPISGVASSGHGWLPTNGSIYEQKYAGRKFSLGIQNKLCAFAICPLCESPPSGCRSAANIGSNLPQNPDFSLARPLREYGKSYSGQQFHAELLP